MGSFIPWSIYHDMYMYLFCCSLLSSYRWGSYGRLTMSNMSPFELKVFTHSLTHSLTNQIQKKYRKHGHYAGFCLTVRKTTPETKEKQTWDAVCICHYCCSLSWIILKSQKYVWPSVQSMHSYCCTKKIL